MYVFNKIASCLLFLCIAGASKSATLEVGKNKTYTTITQAIAGAKGGDTVLVYGGVYREGNLIIDKNITFSGVEYPVIDGENKCEIISVKADNVTVKGFKIVHTGTSSIVDMAGIKIYNRRNVVIENNILEDTFFGIYMQQTLNCVIRNNILTSNRKEEQQSGNGIHCWKSDSLRIIANTITGHRDGIYFEFVTHSVIWRNTSSGNLRYGLHFMFSNYDDYMVNIFKNNGAGVSVMFSHHIKMIRNYFEENWGDAAYGILLKEITDSYIQGNTFSKNTSGIYMEGANRIQMEKNIFKDNGWGLKIQASCMDIVLKYNNFLGNTFDVGTNGSLVLNTFSNNYWDKYEGYDLNKDGIGDVPYRPVSLYSMIIEKNPPAMILFRSFMTNLLDKTEKVLPVFIPENLKDDKPLMKPINL
ncbi:nitrous oxide reductase family maturation protein NosD [Chitinophagaceae bacterium LWZ2-11]